MRSPATRALVLSMLSIAGIHCRGDDHYLRPPVPVRIRTVAPAERSGAVHYSGSVAADTEVILAFKLGGYVATIAENRLPDGGRRLVQAGDPVKRSAVLATIRRNDYSTKLAELEGMRDDAKASAAQAKLDLDRASTLLSQRVIPQSEFDALKARHDALRGEANAADARVGQAGIALSDTVLRSPLDGIVLHRAIEVGDLMAPGAPAFLVADTRRVKVVFGVSDSVQKTLRLGQAATMRTEALPGVILQARISKIAAKADDKSRLFDVEASVDNADQALKVGMIATVELDSGSALRGDPAVPLSAVVQVRGTGDEFAVYVVTAKDGSSVARRRPVVLGDLVRNDVTVTSGLAGGEQVVVVGANVVRDGERVAVIP